MYDQLPTKLNEVSPTPVESENGVDGRVDVQVCCRDILPLEITPGFDMCPFSQNVDGDAGLAVDVGLGSILEHCPRLEAFRLSGSLCSTGIVKQIVQGMKPSLGHPSSLRVLGLGPVGPGILWNDLAHVLCFTGVSTGLEKVVIAEGDLRAIPADARCVTLEKFDDVRRKGIDVVFAEHRRVGDLL